MRTFTFLAGRHGHRFEFYPPKVCEARLARIRVVAVVIFRKWFGREPHESWGVDGFMAEARDRQGRFIQVEQFDALEIYRNLALNGSRPVALLPEICQGNGCHGNHSSDQHSADYSGGAR
jgi:hypothetical protein